MSSTLCIHLLIVVALALTKLASSIKESRITGRSPQSVPFEALMEELKGAYLSQAVTCILRVALSTNDF